MSRAAAVISRSFLLLAAAAMPASAAIVHVEVKGVGFIPAKLSAKLGDIVEWSNRDFVAHTATARGGAWDVNLPPNKAGSTVLKKAGRVEYYCRYHPTMKAEIDVRPK